MSGLLKVAAINDLSGSGRCSLTAAIPILASFGVQCFALPTAVLTNHTGYEKFTFDDYTAKMDSFIDDWQNQGWEFDCICTGFLGSEAQIDIAERFFDTFKSEKTKILVDPVMGDDGKIYSTYTSELCEKMKKLVKRAYLVTPNVTEACILSGVPYVGDGISAEEARTVAEKICALGAENVVITGIKREKRAINYVYGSDGEGEFSSPLVPVYYSGTGDVFASVLCGFLARGGNICDGVEFASQFIAKASALSNELGLSCLEGICFEKFLKEICEL